MTLCTVHNRIVGQRWYGITTLVCLWYGSTVGNCARRLKQDQPRPEGFLRLFKFEMADRIYTDINMLHFTPRNHIKTNKQTNKRAI